MKLLSDQASSHPGHLFFFLAQPDFYIQNLPFVVNPVHFLLIGNINGLMFCRINTILMQCLKI
jgi:hypothetical protein